MLLGDYVKEHWMSTKIDSRRYEGERAKEMEKLD